MESREIGEKAIDILNKLFKEDISLADIILIFSYANHLVQIKAFEAFQENKEASK